MLEQESESVLGLGNPISFPVFVLMFLLEEIAFTEAKTSRPPLDPACLKISFDLSCWSRVIKRPHVSDGLLWQSMSSAVA